LDNLIQEGNIGLMESVDKFSPDYGFRFNAYVSNFTTENQTPYLVPG